MPQNQNSAEVWTLPLLSPHIGGGLSRLLYPALFSTVVWPIIFLPNAPQKHLVLHKLQGSSRPLPFKFCLVSPWKNGLLCKSIWCLAWKKKKFSGSLKSVLIDVTSDVDLKKIKHAQSKVWRPKESRSKCTLKTERKWTVLVQFKVLC